MIVRSPSREDRLKSLGVEFYTARACPDCDGLGDDIDTRWQHFTRASGMAPECIGECRLCGYGANEEDFEEVLVCDACGTEITEGDEAKHAEGKCAE